MTERVTVPGGFIVDQDYLPGRCYVLTEGWRPELARVLEQSGAEHLRLSRSMGWKSTDLSFLRQLPFLKGLDVFHWEVKDLSVLEALPKLQLLRLECQFRPLDFGRFPELRLASVRWRAGCDTLLGLTSLEYLFLSKYPRAELSALRELRSLRHLMVASSKLTSLDGLEALEGLTELSIAHCRALADVSALARLRRLRVLELTACPALRQLDAARGLSALERLLVEDCGAIESVSFVEGCPALEELYLIGTRVADGDLSPILRLERLRKVVVPRHAGHSHTLEELQAALGHR